MTDTVLITGTSKGLGKALAEHFLAAGATVYGCARSSGEGPVSGRYCFSALDFAKPQSLSLATQSWLPEACALDLVVLNAAQLGSISDLQEQSLDHLQRMMDVNLWANKVLLDLLFQRCASVRQVVAISSGVSLQGRRGWGAYSITKAALNHMMELYAAERPETHFSSLAPGIVDTDMQAYLCSPQRDGERFPSLQFLRQARGTSQMPTPQKAAALLAKAFPVLLGKPSGSYADLRKLELEP